jgi:hypothetical protein
LLNLAKDLVNGFDEVFFEAFRSEEVWREMVALQRISGATWRIVALERMVIVRTLMVGVLRAEWILIAVVTLVVACCPSSDMVSAEMHILNVPSPVWSFMPGAGTPVGAIWIEVVILPIVSSSPVLVPTHDQPNGNDSLGG